MRREREFSMTLHYRQKVTPKTAEISFVVAEITQIFHSFMFTLNHYLHTILRESRKSLNGEVERSEEGQ
jgi:hypothetical protein